MRQKQIIQKGGEEAGGAQQTQSKLRLVSAAGSETAAGARNRRLKLNQQLSLEVACNTVQGLTKGLRA